MSTSDEVSEPKSPEQLREEIEETRQALGETVEELSAKTDVKARLSATTQSVKDSISAKRSAAGDKRDEVVEKAQDAIPDSAQDGIQQVGTAVKQRPVPASAIAGFVAGVLVGWWLARR